MRLFKFTANNRLITETRNFIRVRNGINIHAVFWKGFVETPLRGVPKQRAGSNKNQLPRLRYLPIGSSRLASLRLGEDTLVRAWSMIFELRIHNRPLRLT